MRLHSRSPRASSASHSGLSHCMLRTHSLPESKPVLPRCGVAALAAAPLLLVSCSLPILSKTGSAGRQSEYT